MSSSSNPSVSGSGVTGSIQMSLLAFDKIATIGVDGQLYLDTYDPSFNQWDAVAKCDVSLNTIRDMFIFHTDHIDVNDEIPEDIRFYVDASYIPQSLNLHTSIVDNGAVLNVTYGGNLLSSSERVLAKDYIRHLSQILFNTPFGVDLFINEEDLVNSVNTALNDTWESSCRADLECVSTQGTHANLQGNPDGASKYLLANSEAEDLNYASKYNICRELFRMLVSRVPSRFIPLSNLLVGSTQKQNMLQYEIDQNDINLYFLPLEVGDQILMRVTIKPDPTQSSFTGVSANDATIRANERAYIIALNLV